MSLDPVAAHRMASASALLYASADPLAAVKTLALAIKGQPLGGRRAIARVLLESLIRDDPRTRSQLLAGIAADLAAINP